MRPTVDPELDERTVVDKQVQALARGQLVGGVLLGDLLGAAALLDVLAARREILGERSKQAVGGSCHGRK
jgi:hypothetical protein